jgi:hydroxymethylpyrimidine pyrophosphatase-like HAD family hydrolase
MGNATEQVKSEADDITLDNNSEGIAKALLKYIPELSV